MAQVLGSGRSTPPIDGVMRTCLMSVKPVVLPVLKEIPRITSPPDARAEKKFDPFPTLTVSLNGLPNASSA